LWLIGSYRCPEVDSFENMNTRDFIKNTISGAALGSLGVNALGARREELPGVQVGTSPSFWGVWFADDPLKSPWQRFLDEAPEAGYKAI